MIQAPLIPGAAFGVATDATSVYWTMPSAGTVMKCSAADCKGTVVTLASAQFSPLAVAVDEARVYWATGGSHSAVLSCPIDGGAPTTIASGQAQLTSIAIDAKNIYWTRYDDDSAFMCPKDGCPAGPILLAKGGVPVGVGTVTSDGTNVYWGNGDLDLVECPTTGCNGVPMTLASASESGIAVDANDIYWTSVGGNLPSTLMRCAKQDCAATTVTLASGQYVWMNIVSDESNLYWGDPQYGSVLRCPKPACAGGPVTLASGGATGSESLVAVNASTIYWTTMAGLMSTPK